MFWYTSLSCFNGLSGSVRRPLIWTPTLSWLIGIGVGVRDQTFYPIGIGFFVRVRNDRVEVFKYGRRKDLLKPLKQDKVCTKISYAILCTIIHIFVWLIDWFNHLICHVEGDNWVISILVLGPKFCDTSHEPSITHLHNPQKELFRTSNQPPFRICLWRTRQLKIVCKNWSRPYYTSK